jgi:aminoglycoside phosphotransferase (APT) family kinase protein
MDTDDVISLLKIHDIKPACITSTIGSFSKQIFFIDDRYLLRTSNNPMDNEVERFNRVRYLASTPKILFDGIFKNNEKDVHYIMLDLLPGDDLFSICDSLDGKQISSLGSDIALFLDRLHSINGDSYDIGHYIPSIPGYAKSWKEGHAEYLKILKDGIRNIDHCLKNKSIIETAFIYLEKNMPSLAYQNGPRLLHNDFHPKNIIVNKGGFSGIIDWECSQYGEIDFELSHLIHWCVFPSNKKINLKPFLKAFLGSKPICSNVPELHKRLTIYLIEHDIIQIIWSKGKSENEYVDRIRHWLDEGVSKLFNIL